MVLTEKVPAGRYGRRLGATGAGPDGRTRRLPSWYGSRERAFPTKCGRSTRDGCFVNSYASDGTPKYSEHEYFLAVAKAFTQWEAMQNVGQ
jgi:hypothetical protein